MASEAKLFTLRCDATAGLRHCVRRARLAAGLSREAAALDVGVSDDSILRWEQGTAEPKCSLLLDAPLMGPFFRAEMQRFLAQEAA